MREVTVAQKQVRDGEGNAWICDYTLLVREVEISPRFACESYGVRIQERGGELAQIPDITVSPSRIEELMALLVRNGVTPCTLRDVIDDWL